MARLFVCDRWITVDIEADGPVLGAALECENAESVVRCAMLMALSALAEGGRWPAALLDCMERFMAGMRDEVCTEQLN